MNGVIQIAIDGPAGSGKSTVAKKIAKELNIFYLDTGAMYRSVAYIFFSENINIDDDLEKKLDDLKLSVRFIDNEQKIFYDNHDITEFLRSKEVSQMASVLAMNYFVRNKLVKLQREISKFESVVLDGRDIGTVVLPDASLKIYLSASLDKRATRRHLEFKNFDKAITLEEVKRDILIRDKRDINREFGPLKKAKDAIEIDTTDLNVEEVVVKILELLRSKDAKIF